MNRSCRWRCLLRGPFLLMPSPQRVLRRRNLEPDSRIQLVLFPSRCFLHPLRVLLSVHCSGKNLMALSAKMLRLKFW